MWDDAAGYDRDDPKHPDFAEMWFAHADMLRKREKEAFHDMRRVDFEREQMALADVLLREDEGLD